MNKKATVIIISAIVFLGVGCNQLQSVNIGSGENTSGTVSIFTVKEVVALSNVPNTFMLRAYVLDKYICPPCASPGFCEPCLSSNYVTVADKFSGVKGYSKADPQIKLFFKLHDETFKLETLYDFTIVKKSNKYNPAVMEFWIEYYNAVPLEV